MNQRINIVLPEATIRTIDRLARPGQRSRFINQAVQHYVAENKAASLRARLEETAVRDRDLDREIMQDWLEIDREQWRTIDQPVSAKKRTLSVAKSTSRRSTRR